MTYTFTAIDAGHPRLLQRNAGRPAGRDGPVWRHHRAAHQRHVPRALSRAACTLRTWHGASATGAKPTSGWRAAAYDHPAACYDREYLFQFSEIDPRIHRQAEAQVTGNAGCAAGAPGCS